jgi:processive 1,2-diacylglycerol beta-glucosyltransferase
MVLKPSNVGQEEENIKFIKDTGIGILIQNYEELEDLIRKTIENTEDLDDIRKNIEEVKEELEPDKIGKYILELM